jgi:hypothetical protein
MVAAKNTKPKGRRGAGAGHDTKCATRAGPMSKTATAQAIAHGWDMCLAQGLTMTAFQKRPFMKRLSCEPLDEVIVSTGVPLGPFCVTQVLQVHLKATASAPDQHSLATG